MTNYLQYLSPYPNGRLSEAYEIIKNLIHAYDEINMTADEPEAVQRARAFLADAQLDKGGEAER